MTAFFGKYWYLVVIGIITVLCFAVFVQIFKETNWLAAWLFKFLNEWALVLSASATILLAIAAFLTIMVNRRSQALNEINRWVDDAARVLTIMFAKKVTPVELIKEMRASLHPITAKSLSIVADAGRIGGDFEEKTGKAVINLLDLGRILDEADMEGISEDSFNTIMGKTHEILDELKEVMKSTSKL